MALDTIADRARTNMLGELGLSEPQLLSNIDVMAVLLLDGAQSLIVVVPEWTPAKHYWEYLIVLRDNP